MNKIKLVYIASPFTYKADYQPLRDAMEKMRYQQVTRVTALLIKKFNIAPIAPITMSYNFVESMDGSHDGEFAAWADIDYRYIKAVDEVWVITMDGWERSTGVQAEIAYADKKGIPVKYVDEDLLTLHEAPPFKGIEL